ncbi:conserved hypothetical protein, partial [Ricinus communis]
LYKQEWRRAKSLTWISVSRKHCKHGEFHLNSLLEDSSWKLSKEFHTVGRKYFTYLYSNVFWLVAGHHQRHGLNEHHKQHKELLHAA